MWRSSPLSRRCAHLSALRSSVSADIVLVSVSVLYVLSSFTRFHWLVFSSLPILSTFLQARSAHEKNPAMPLGDRPMRQTPLGLLAYSTSSRRWPSWGYSVCTASICCTPAS